ncbi:MAG: sensor histidine kinase [Bacteroidota bacterium]
MKLVAFILSVLFFFSLNGQEIKSLKAKIAHAKSETDLMELYDKLGAEYFYKGDFPQAQKSFFKALRYAEKTKNQYSIASGCNNIASVYNEIQQQKKGIPYILKAIKIQKELEEYYALSNAYNTLGVSYYQMLDFPNAIKNYEKSVYYMLKSPDSLYVGTAYQNLGLVNYENKNPQDGIKNLKKSLYYHKKIADSASLFSSLVSLVDIYSNLDQLDSAQLYLSKSDAIYPKLKSILALNDYYYSKYIFHKKKKDYKLALENHVLYLNYNDSLINESSKEEIYSIQDKYKAEKADFKLQAQKKILAREKKIKRILYVLFGLILIVLILFILWLRGKQKQRIKFILLEQKKVGFEKMLEGEEKERTRIAKELHDGVVQDLTVLKMNLNEFKEDESDELNQRLTHFISNLDKTAQEVRNISYQMMPVTLKELGLISAIEDLFHRSLTVQKISYDFEHFGFENRLSEKIEVSLYRICQELVNNVVKHSKANAITVVLKKTDDFVTLIFEDNGTGFNENTIKKGIGLSSLNSRIDLIHGEINFDSTSNSGTTVFIRIPL